MTRERRTIRVRGRVQGVGFRPAVCRLAGKLAPGRLRLQRRRRRLDRGRGVRRCRRPLPERPAGGRAPAGAHRGGGDRGGGHAGRAPVPHRRQRRHPLGPGAQIPPDLAPCADCLRELGDPADRRHHYPFINCTACGPRFTIVREVPYDRGRTTMDAFPLCAACPREYGDPATGASTPSPTRARSAAPAHLRRRRAATPARAEALQAALACWPAGGVLAVKGVGGFVLATDATRRRRGGAAAPAQGPPPQTRSPSWPATCATAEQRGTAGDVAAAAALASPARPIVLCPLRPGAAAGRRRGARAGRGGALPAAHAAAAAAADRGPPCR